ncbi:DUF4129 domain-containing protein [Nonomuraea sp. NPDC048826]|uniref:DUF4129 domain-containing protein n=1 Tax=Nonomuraea sp. NPDC048826 TaxID=3364347 RepID=UPI00371AE33B
MSPIGREEAAERAARELLGPQYAQEPLFDRLMRYARQFINDLLDATAGGGTAGGILAAIVILLLLVSVAVLITWQVRRAGRRRAAPSGELFDDRRLTAAEHRQAAERFAAESRWTEAIQERLRAIARDLEERALVDGMPGRTADELAAEAGLALPPFAADLTAAARSFDEVTYGGVPGTSAAYDFMTALDTRLATARPVPLETTP